MSKITAEHIKRAAYVYVRQSTLEQVQINQECQSARKRGSDSMLVQFDGTMSGISKENRRHEPWNLVGTVWACYRAYRIRNGQAFACSSTDIDDGGLSEL